MNNSTWNADIMFRRGRGVEDGFILAATPIFVSGNGEDLDDATPTGVLLHREFSILSIAAWLFRVKVGVIDRFRAILCVVGDTAGLIAELIGTNEVLGLTGTIMLLFTCVKFEFNENIVSCSWGLNARNCFIICTSFETGVGGTYEYKNFIHN